MQHVLAVNSLPAYGTAGLKSVLSVLGPRTLPMPSLILSGLGNIPGHQRFTYDFKANLAATFRHLQQYGESCLLYIGYLGAASQIDDILELWSENRSVVDAILVDPVSGDNGKAYVSGSIIEGWQKLLAVADWATPNSTECLLLSGASSLEPAVGQLRGSFPLLQWIVTSYPAGAGMTGNRLIAHGGEELLYVHPERPEKISGAGDWFASQFIHHFFFEKRTAGEAVKKAGEQTLLFIDRKRF